MRITESIKHYVIAMENGEEFIFEDEKEKANELFFELYEEDKDAISQFYSKEWIKHIPREEEALEGWEEEIEEGEVEIFFRNGDDDYCLDESPEVIEADESLSIILGEYPNFHASGSVQGMRDMFYGQSAFLVRCGEYIYKVSEDIYNSIKDGGVKDWIKTDDNQLCLKITNDIYKMINVVEVGDKLVLLNEDVDFSELSNSDLEEAINGYYNSLEEVKELYKEDWKMIVAECISEQLNSDDKVYFDTIEDVNNHLEANSITIKLEVF